MEESELLKALEEGYSQILSVSNLIEMYNLNVQINLAKNN